MDRVTLEILCEYVDVNSFLSLTSVNKELFSSLQDILNLLAVTNKIEGNFNSLSEFIKLYDEQILSFRGIEKCERTSFILRCIKEDNEILLNKVVNFVKYCLYLLDLSIRYNSNKCVEYFCNIMTDIKTSDSGFDCYHMFDDTVRSSVKYGNIEIIKLVHNLIFNDMNKYNCSIFPMEKSLMVGAYYLRDENIYNIVTELYGEKHENMLYCAIYDDNVKITKEILDSGKYLQLTYDYIINDKLRINHHSPACLLVKGLITYEEALKEEELRKEKEITDLTILFLSHFE